MDDCGKDDCFFEKVYNTGEVQTHIRHSPPPNEAFWQVTQTPLTDENGKINAVMGTWYRITEQVMLKREIETHELRFRSFLNSAHDMISIKDLDGRYLIANPATSLAFKRRPEEFIGKKPDELIPIQTASTVMKHDKDVIESGEHRTYDEIILIDGKERLFHTVRFPLTDLEGNVTGVCTIARDVSKERVLQNELAEAGKLAAIGKLAAGVAHEINNPLTGVLAFAEDIKDEFEDGDPLKDDMQVIIRETLRCRDIVKNLLDFSRQDIPELVSHDVNEILDQVLQLVEKLPRFRDVIIEKEFEDNPPEIECDPKQMQQVVLNLMLNASEAMNHKGIIRLKTKYNRKKDNCTISVSDNGPGIPEGNEGKVFEPFFSTKGTSGLGLAVIWGIVERHHGHIEVGKSEDGGALFEIIFPVKLN